MRDWILRFLRDRRGNFAMVTGFAIGPLLLGVGLSVDVTNISRRQNELQQAVDGAVLAVAREGAGLADATARDLAKDLLIANFDQRISDIMLRRQGTAADLAINSTTDLYFGNLFGKASWPLQASASADVAYIDYEIGLILDTTESMRGPKLAAMKQAVLDLVGTISTQVDDPERLKFAIVPFADFVNVGPQFGPSFDKDGAQIAGTGADWLDLKGQSDIPQVELAPGASRFQLYQNLAEAWPGCVETRYAENEDYGISDDTPDVADVQTLFVPAFAIDEPDPVRSGPVYGNSYLKSNAIPNNPAVAQLRKRFAKYGVKTTSAGIPLLGGLLDPLVVLLEGVLFGSPQAIRFDDSASPVTGKPKGPGMGCDVQPVMPLSGNYADVQARINALKASGHANLPEGVAWGMRVLSPGKPFDEGKPAGSEVEKIMIVVSGGANQFGNNATPLGSSYTSNGYLVDGRLGVSSGGAAVTNTIMNTRTLAACENAKAEGIEIFTVRLEQSDNATGEMLGKCASDPGHYFDVPTRAQLEGAFQGIRKRTVKVRISS